MIRRALRRFFKPLGPLIHFTRCGGADFSFTFNEGGYYLGIGLDWRADTQYFGSLCRVFLFLSCPKPLWMGMIQDPLWGSPWGGGKSRMMRDWWALSVGWSVDYGWRWKP